MTMNPPLAVSGDQAFGSSYRVLARRHCRFGAGGSGGRLAVSIAVLAVGLAAGACRKEEQGRQLSFEPGVYKGPVPDKLSSTTVRQLQDRGALQK